MPRPGFEPGSLDYMTSALPTELSGLPSKQGNNLTYMAPFFPPAQGGKSIPTPNIRRRPTNETGLPSKVEQIHANEFL